MELFNYAEQILFGKSLEEKLISPEVLTDTLKRSPLVAAPLAPGRPHHLAITDSRIPGAQSFPKVWELEKDAKRGEVLHFFANHELLALETMALVLLRFPDAPKSFRRGLAQTMRDEQKHLNLYLRSMARLGVELGAVPLGGYFWRALCDLQSPYEFVLKMGLTFEQANLDFALYYKMLFTELKDFESAAVMDEVYEDEVRHVRHSLQWFRTWKPASESDWRAFSSALKFPLSPSRAKGTVYSFEARKAVGFDIEFIEELQIYNQSKGRPPRVFVYNPSQEFEVGLNGHSYTEPKLHQEVAADLESLLLFLASPDDVLALRNPLTPSFKGKLACLGFEIPQVVSYDEKKRSIAWERGRKIDSLVPWGVSPSMSTLEHRLLGAAFPVAAHSPVSAAQSEFAFKKIVSKSFVPFCRALVRERLVQYLGDLAQNGNLDQNARCVAVARSLEEVFHYAKQFFECSQRYVVLKAPFGSSGQNQLRIERGVLEESQLYWIRRVLNQFNEIVVEPWRNIVVEFSVQAQVLSDRQVVVHGVVRNICSQNGQYLASVAGKALFDLPLDVRRFLYESAYGELLERTAAVVGEFLAAQQYQGPFGIDSYVFRNRESKLDVNLVGELNLRYTMGRVALELKKKAQAGRSVILSLAPVDQATERLSGEHCEFSSSGSSKLISKGFFPLSDACRAFRIVPLAWVGSEKHAGAFLRSFHSST